jgi:hypothetical protein
MKYDDVITRLERIERRLGLVGDGFLKLADNYVIVRGDRSGVFAGELSIREGREVKLLNSRRLWYWSGAASLSQLAVDGPSNPNECKFPCEMPEQIILDALEVIAVTEKAQKSIKGVPEWKV